MLRFEDRLRSHPYFFRAAIAATKALLFLHDNPEIPITAAQRLEKEMENLSVADRKKAVKKADKEKEKADKGKEGKKEEEFDGEKILEGAKGDLLAEATKIFVKPLLEQSPGRVESQILGAEVYIRRSGCSRCLIALAQN